MRALKAASWVATEHLRSLTEACGAANAGALDAARMAAPRAIEVGARSMLHENRS
jgi:hypothetical protein